MGAAPVVSKQYSVSRSLDEGDMSSSSDEGRGTFFKVDANYQESEAQEPAEYAQIGKLNVPLLTRYPYIDFRFEKKIGTGRFSTVYKAVSLKEKGIKVAVKEVKVAGMSKQQIADFRYELNVLSQLQHKHICRLASVYDPMSNNSIIYVVMEYLKGGELIPAICRQKEFFESDAKRFIRQLCSAMQHMHRHGVIHGNLVPENLVLTKVNFRSNLRVVDFGNAKVEHHRRQGGSSGGVGNGARRLIAEDFRAPEIATERKPSFYSDVWSVGVIAHLLVSGSLPFEMGQTSIHPLHKVRSFLDPRWEDVSHEAIEFIMKTVVIEPKERPRADELPKDPWLLQSIGEAAIERNYAQSKENDQAMIDEQLIESRKHDLTLNLQFLRSYQEQRVSMQTLIVSSGAITFFKLGRYVCEKNLALLTDKPLLDVNIMDSDND